MYKDECPTTANAETPAFRGSIFISYRRADAPGCVRALMSELRGRFGSQQVFLDREDIEAGSHFPEVIDEAVGGCEVTLAVIGPRWLTLQDADGLRRLDDPEDYVRLEVHSSIARGIPVIPVLVDQAQMPAREELPEVLQRLSLLNAVVLTYDHWDDDIAQLTEAIESVTTEPRLARLYAQALQRLDEGHWQLALQDFETVSRLQPHYRDVAERLTHLQALKGRCGRIEHPNFWCKTLLSYPITSLLLLCLLPNLLAAQFNYDFNWQVIVADMARRGMADAQAFFLLSVRWVNAVAFPLGMTLWLVLAWPVRLAVLGQCKADGSSPAMPAKAIRLRCLALGWQVAVICSTLWLIVGPLYPLLIGSLATLDYVYFTLSLTICGIMAATYPFLYVTWLCVHILYPKLLQPGAVDAQEVRVLQDVRNWAFRALMAAGVVPLLIVTLALAMNSHIGSAGPLVAMLGFMGLLGFGLALWLFRAIQRDVDFLEDLVKAYGGKALRLQDETRSLQISGAVRVRSA